MISHEEVAICEPWFIASDLSRSYAPRASMPPEIAAPTAVPTRLPAMGATAPMTPRAIPAY